VRLSYCPIAVAVLVACSTSTLLDHAGILTVVPAPGSVTLANNGPDPIFYFAIEQATASLLAWAPCVSPSAPCRRVLPQSRVQLLDSAIQGYQPGATEALVFWWHLVPNPPDGFRPDSIRMIIVRLL